MLASLVPDKRVVVCCGAGGVGKTTTAAALGLSLARRGKRVVVLTIDPARRLADALGLPELPGDPAPVPRDRLDAAGVPLEGSLHALMLDPKATFDGLVTRLSPDPAAARRVLDNRLYQHVSAMLAGMQEYTAEEKLHELHGDARFDVVVVDTPPARNALDFLEAPGRLSRFLDDRVLKWFVPQKGGPLALLQRTGKVVSSVLGKVFGETFVAELSEFLAAMGGITRTFRAHAEEVRALLASPEAAFVLVTAPETAALEDALFFRKRIGELQLPFAGYVVNRLHEDRARIEPAEADATFARLSAELGEGEARALMERLLASYEAERGRAALDRLVLHRLRAEGQAPLVGVPRLEGEIADVGGLSLLADRAFLPAA